MSLQQIDFSKVINDDQVYDHMMANYDQLGKDWINHQWRWMNAVYQAFKDHYKYMIIISLVEKTLQFYDQMNIKLCLCSLLWASCILDLRTFISTLRTLFSLGFKGFLISLSAFGVSDVVFSISKPLFIIY